MIDNIFPIGLLILSVYAFYNKFISTYSGTVEPVINEILHDKYRKIMLRKYNQDSILIKLDN